MAGVKGRSGRVYTLEGKRARAEAARKRWGIQSAEKPDDGSEPPPADGDMRTIADHDRQLGKPQTWPDALKRLQLVEQDVINEKREVELEEARIKLDVARGLYVLSTELEKAIALQRDAWWREMQQVPSLALQRLSDVPADIRARVKVAVEQAIAHGAEQVKKSLT